MRFLLILLITFTLFSCRKKEFEDQVIPKKSIGLDILDIQQSFQNNPIKINEFGNFTIKVSPNDTIGDDIFYNKDRTYTISYTSGDDILKLVDETNLQSEIDPKDKTYTFDSIYTFKLYPKSVGKKSIRIQFISNGKSVIKTYVLYVHHLDTKVDLYWVSKYANSIDDNNGDYLIKTLKSYQFTQGDTYDYNKIMAADTSNETGNYVSYYRNGSKVVKHVDWGLMMTEDIKEQYYIYYSLDSRVSSSQMILRYNGVNINGMKLPNVYMYEPDYKNGFNFEFLPALDHPHSWKVDPSCTGFYCSYCYNHVNDTPFEIYLTIKNSKNEVVKQDTLKYYMLPRDCMYNIYKTASFDNSRYDTYGNETPFGTITHRKVWKWDATYIPQFIKTTSY